MPRYYALTGVNAMNYLDTDLEEEPVSVDEFAFIKGTGDLIELAPLEKLQSKLEETQSNFPSLIKRGTGDGGRFELQGCEHVHRELSSFPAEALADPEFWIWVTVANFSELVQWRFGVYPHRAKLSNYGIGSGTEGMIMRMWLRGEIGYDGNLKDPYELSRVGDQDLWRSHIIRQGYGNVREVSRSLLRLQSGKLGHPRLGVNEIRQLAKQIRRLRANVFLESFSGAQCDALILELCDGLQTSA